jgi:hypothetical protein
LYHAAVGVFFDLPVVVERGLLKAWYMWIVEAWLRNSHNSILPRAKLQLEQQGFTC